MQKLRRCRADACSRAPAHYMAGRPDAQAGNGFRNPDPRLVIREHGESRRDLAGRFESHMGILACTRYRYSRRRSWLDRSQRRLSESIDDEYEARLPEKKRRALQRECRFDGILRSRGGAQWRRLPSSHLDGGRSNLSGSGRDVQHAIQEADRPFRLESDSLRGKVNTQGWRTVMANRRKDSKGSSE